MECVRKWQYIVIYAKKEEKKNKCANVFEVDEECMYIWARIWQKGPSGIRIMTV